MYVWEWLTLAIMVQPPLVGLGLTRPEPRDCLLHVAQEGKKREEGSVGECQMGRR